MTVLQLRLGDLALREGKGRAAIAHFRRAHEAAACGLGVRSDDSDLRMKDALVLEREAQAVEKVSPHKALRLYLEAVMALRRLMQEKPQDFSLRQRVADGELKLARIEKAAGHAEKEEQHLREYLRMGDRATQSGPPSVAWLDARIEALAELGNHDLAKHRFVEAAGEVREIIRLRRQIIDGPVAPPKPTSSKVTAEREARDKGYRTLAKIELKAGRKPEALTSMKDALASAKLDTKRMGAADAEFLRQLNAAVDLFEFAEQVEEPSVQASAAREIVASIKEIDEQQLLSGDPLVSKVKKLLPAIAEVAQVVPGHGKAD